MSTVKEALARLRSKVMPRRYYTEPKGYWEQRHTTFGSNLEGIGRLGLSEADNEVAYLAKWDKVQAALTEIGASGRLLDAGCGIGWFTQRFVDAGYTVDAFDFTQAGIDVAKERVEGDVTWAVSDLASFRSDREYDVVTCIDVLFHVVDDDIWRASVDNLRTLAAGGHLIIQEHLVADAAPLTSGATGTKHTRWRSLEQYTAQLDGCELVRHTPYVVDAEGAEKDLMVFRVPAAG